MEASIDETEFSADNLFNIDCQWKVPGFTLPNEYVPEIEPGYHFDKKTALAILAGFKFNKRVLLQGLHGTGKSSHISQVAALLNWPCIRINLDSHVSRLDLLGKDGIVINDGKQTTEFQPGILTWAIQNPIALILDEYDAGRPDVMFVIQHLLEQGGKLTLLDQKRTITPHPKFRLFATANTVGLGDTTGLYQGTQLLNQGQLDRWNIIATLDYLAPEQEIKILLGKFPELDTPTGRTSLQQKVMLADLTRESLKYGDLSIVMSPRTLISWVENEKIFSSCNEAFKFSFYNRCDENEKELLKELYHRCMGTELD